MLLLLFNQGPAQPVVSTAFITGTDALQLPVNCVLIGQQLYERTGRTFERIPGKSGTRTIASVGGRMGGETSFTVTTNAKGYD
jgi:hypothetical protein